MKALFRADANESIGLGHMMRCLALAQELDAQGIQAYFAVRPGSTERICNRRDWVGEILPIPDDVSLEQEPDWLKELCLSQAIDFLILDGYQFDQQYREKLAAANPVFACFDDQNAMPNLPCDLVINGAENAGTLGYENTAPAAVKCLGAEFRILRKEFFLENSSDLSRLKRLCLVFGGSDPKGLTLSLLKALEQQGFNDPIHVLTGAAYGQLSELESFLKDSALPIEHIHDCQDVAKEFRQARLTVSAAGGSQFELLACRSPSILAIVADNQVNATLGAQQQNWCVAVDCRVQHGAEELADKVLSLWFSADALGKMESHAQQQEVHNGAKSVVEALKVLRNNK